MSARRGPVGERPALSAVAGWVVYDLANTLFSMNIVSLYLPLWVVNEMGGQDSHFGYATALSMGLMFLTAPALGALSDQAGRRMPFLIAVTVGCVSLTWLLGAWGLATSLALFVAANYLFQAGLIFYDALLPVVSTAETRGRIGGIGVGVGYLGSFIGVGLGALLLDNQIAVPAVQLGGMALGGFVLGPVGYRGVFQLTALLFLLFALPCFVLVREPSRGRARRVDRGAVADSFRALRHTIPKARATPGMTRFLVGRFLYTDPANTIIVFMTIYVTNEIGLARSEAERLLLAAIAAAVAGGIVWGAVVDRVGPKRTLNAVLTCWLVALGVVVAVARPGVPGWLIWPAGMLAGASLGGLWSADRPYMLRLTPPRFLGEFYGLYSMVGRFAAIIGPLTWGFVVNTLGVGRPAAVLSLMLLMAAALAVLQGVDDTPRDWPAEFKT